MITSVNICAIPFLGNTDSTRLQMSAKQISQSLTHLNTEIPYIVSEEYYHLTENSEFGIGIAKDDGEVIYNYDGLMIVFYPNRRVNNIESHFIPNIKKTYSIFATKLRNSLKTGEKFNKGDILFEYDCFTNGIPSYGYNAFSAFLPFFGFNHEDSLIISESYANKAKAYFIETLYIPIYQHTILRPIYLEKEDNIDEDDYLFYFPSIGQKIKDTTFCQIVVSKDPQYTKAIRSKNKNKIAELTKNLKPSDLFSIYNFKTRSISVNDIKCRIKNGTVNKYKVHKFNETQLLDSRLNIILEKMYYKYINDELYPIYEKLSNSLTENEAKSILKKHYVYKDKELKRGKINLANVVYLIEVEIIKEQDTIIGDKIANSFANKGIISHILPDELRPIALDSNCPIDVIYNPFAVFSRMNLGQILEGTVSKSVHYADKVIRENPNKTVEILRWLNENVIKFLNKHDMSYYNSVNNLIDELKNNSLKLDRFIEDINKNNLFILGPSFAEVDIRGLLNSESIKPNERVLIKKETLNYMKNILGLEIPFEITDDIILDNIFCSSIYSNKLYKLVEETMNTRDFGPVKSMTRQPLRGRANSGGSKLGQMEIEGILAHGSERSVKELMTTKSDWEEGKTDLVRQITVTGGYNFPRDKKVESRTKQIVDTFLTFLKG